MTNTGRKKRRKNAVVTMAFRLFFVLLLLSMLAAYISIRSPSAPSGQNWKH